MAAVPPPPGAGGVPHPGGAAPPPPPPPPPPGAQVQPHQQGPMTDMMAMMEFMTRRTAPVLRTRTFLPTAPNRPGASANFVPHAPVVVRGNVGAAPPPAGYFPAAPPAIPAHTPLACLTVFAAGPAPLVTPIQANAVARYVRGLWVIREKFDTLSDMTIRGIAAMWAHCGNTMGNRGIVEEPAIAPYNPAGAALTAVANALHAQFGIEVYLNPVPPVAIGGAPPGHLANILVATTLDACALYLPAADAVPFLNDVRHLGSIYDRRSVAQAIDIGLDNIEAHMRDSQKVAFLAIAKMGTMTARKIGKFTGVSGGLPAGVTPEDVKAIWAVFDRFYTSDTVPAPGAPPEGRARVEAYMFNIIAAFGDPECIPFQPRTLF